MAELQRLPTLLIATVLLSVVNMDQDVHFQDEQADADLREQVKLLKDEINRLKACCNQDNPKVRAAFSAYLTGRVYDMLSHSTIIFDGIVSNNGNCYNSSSGIFTCNIPGTYVFHHKLSVNSGNYIYSSIMKNDKEIGWNEAAGGKATGGTGSTSVIVDLHYNDVVQVKKKTSSPETKVKPKYSTFSGHRINY